MRTLYSGEYKYLNHKDTIWLWDFNDFLEFILWILFLKIMSLKAADCQERIPPCKGPSSRPLRAEQATVPAQHSLATRAETRASFSGSKLTFTFRHTQLHLLPEKGADMRGHSRLLSAWGWKMEREGAEREKLGSEAQQTLCGGPHLVSINEMKQY